MFRLIVVVFLTVNHLALEAQSVININGIKVNHLDKKNRKQGDWIFFDKSGNVRISTVFKNDSCISSLIFYENSDTAFIRLPMVDSVESFFLYKDKHKYFGNFIHTSDSTTIIEIEPDSTLNDNIIQEIKKYQNIKLEPIYFFAQKKMTEYLSAGFSSSNMIFNKPIKVLLTITSSGTISNVEFPKDQNNLSGIEEKELYWIYSTMPRWQPFFYKNKTYEAKVLLSNNSTLSVVSFNN